MESGDRGEGTGMAAADHPTAETRWSEGYAGSFADMCGSDPLAEADLWHGPVSESSPSRWQGASDSGWWQWNDIEDFRHGRDDNRLQHSWCQAPHSSWDSGELWQKNRDRHWRGASERAGWTSWRSDFARTSSEEQQSSDVPGPNSADVQPIHENRKLPHVVRHNPASYGLSATARLLDQQLIAPAAPWRTPATEEHGALTSELSDAMSDVESLRDMHLCRSTGGVEFTVSFSGLAPQIAASEPDASAMTIYQ